MRILELLAMALDTLPREGRVLLLGCLLAMAFIWFTRLLPADLGSGLNVLFRKGALLALLFVPSLVYLIDVKVPVRVDEVVYWRTLWPAYGAYGVIGIWLAGAFYMLWRLWRDAKQTLALVKAVAGKPSPALKQIRSRTLHWCKRLNIRREVNVVCSGAELCWHTDLGHCTIRLPAAAVNWPVGVLDVMLLSQLAQIHQHSWRWIFFGRCVQALYWPIPGVAKLVLQLSNHLVRPAMRLASAAYGDPEGWRRDVRKLAQRAQTLQAIELPAVMSLIRLPNNGAPWLPAIAEITPRSPDIPAHRSDIRNEEGSFEAKRSSIKRRKNANERDPYEQAYWLIAGACMLAGVATTLTLVQRAPEIDPRLLNIKWQDEMVRRKHDGRRVQKPLSARQAIRSIEGRILKDPDAESRSDAP